MIAKVKGKIDKKLKTSVIVDTGAVAYQVFVPATILTSVNQSEEVALWTHQVVREDSLSLFGFLTFEELEMFELLLAISGVGPKMALGVLAQASLDEIQKAVESSDLTLFTRIPGIGKKNAARIVLELKSKFDQKSLEDITHQPEDESFKEAELALKNLGYTAREARTALSTLGKNLSLEEKIREALKKL